MINIQNPTSRFWLLAVQVFHLIYYRAGQLRYRIENGAPE